MQTNDSSINESPRLLNVRKAGLISTIRHYKIEEINGLQSELGACLRF